MSESNKCVPLHPTEDSTLTAKRSRWSQRYRKEWESDPDCIGWLSQSRRLPSMATCMLCNKELRYESGGLRQLHHHARSSEHIERKQEREGCCHVTEALLPRKQSSLSVAAADGILKLAFFLVEHNVPVATADHIIPLLCSIAPDSKILTEMKAARTKMTAAIHTVANSMQSKVVSLMQTSYFSLVLDEATDISIREQVVILVRAWDTAGIASGKVRSMLLGVEEVSSPTAERIFSVVSDKLEEECIPWKNLIGYTSDGANVMRGRKNSVLTRLVEKKPDLFSLHCTCHQLHLRASAACRVSPGSIEDFLRQTAYFFDHSLKRCAALRQVQATLGVPQYKLIKPTGTRWLSLHQCVERTLEQWDALQTYFSTNSDVWHRDNVRQFVEIMRNNNTRPLLQFLQEVLEHFTKLDKEFQSEEVLIYKLHHRQLEFLRFMLFNCLKSCTLAEASLDLCLTVDLDDS